MNRFERLSLPLVKETGFGLNVEGSTDMLSLGLGLNAVSVTGVRSQFARVLGTLFSNNEPGFLTTISPEFCFADTAGTTPATIGGTVGLALDRSQGLVLGPDVTTTDSVDGLPIGSGVTSYDIGTVSVGSFYEVSVDVSNYSGTGTVGFSAGTTVDAFWDVLSSVVTISANGTLKFKAFARNTSLRLFTRDTNTANFTNISVRELPGNHWTQPTLASRPILGRKPVGGRRNLLLRTEEFDNAYWTKGEMSVVADVASTPFGDRQTADRLVPSATNTASHQVERVFPIVTGQTFTFSAALKADGYNFGQLQINAAGGGFAEFNLQTGAVAGSAGAGFSAAISALGGDWFLCSVTATVNETASRQFRIRVYEDADRTPFSGDGTSGILVGGAQLEVGSTLTPYQRVVTQFDVTEAGKANRHYLFGGGAADPRWMQTPTITPGTDKVQVFAGVRKLSDAATGVLLEASISSSAQNGSLGILSPSSPTIERYDFRSRGTVFSVASTTSVAFNAPTTNVITGLGDISGDLATLRIDGTQVAQSTADQGTGNYLAYPTFIGARAGTALFFNGEIYSLITRFGPNLTTTEIERVEAYVASQVAEETI